MSIVKMETKGDFKNVEKAVDRAIDRHKLYHVLMRYGEKGLKALREATPKDTGLTSESWYYKVSMHSGHSTIQFYNSNVTQGNYAYPIALLIQYGHATPNGGWVEGVDYINPALEPIFKKIAEEAWKEVVGWYG